MNNHIPNTVNLHNLIPCNYRCGFCYAGFPSIKQSRMPQADLHAILRQIASAPRQKILRRKVTFAGGEPLLSSTAVDDIAYARQLGLVTSLVTNGSLLTTEKLDRLGPILDWLTISIDSIDSATNLQIGRHQNGKTQSAIDYLEKIKQAQNLGIKVKINTVVNRVNVMEDFNSFMLQANPKRWKLLQATRVEEENGNHFDRWSITPMDFEEFGVRHSALSTSGIVVVPETQSDIYGSYAMVSPDGRFFDNADGSYRFSRPILEAGIEAAFREVSFSPERFKQRNGDYDFVTGGNLKRNRK